jgi:hypothetical protein
MTDVQMRPVHVFGSPRKVLKGCKFGLDEDVKGILCRGDPLVGVSMERQPQHSWEQFLTTSTHSARTIPEQLPFHPQMYYRYVCLEKQMR